MSTPSGYAPRTGRPADQARRRRSTRVCPNTVVGLFVLGVLNNGLDHINIDSFLKILIRGLILLAALIVNVYAQRLRAEDPKG